VCVGATDSLPGSFGDNKTGDQTVGDGTLTSIQSAYWSGSEYVTFPFYAWRFGPDGGGRTIVSKAGTQCGWAVRPGQVAAPAVWHGGADGTGVVGARGCPAGAAATLVMYALGTEAGRARHRELEHLRRGTAISSVAGAVRQAGAVRTSTRYSVGLGWRPSPAPSRCCCAIPRSGCRRR